MMAKYTGNADKFEHNANATVDSSLLDLRFLTNEERERIRNVLEKDEKLRTANRIRLG